MLMLLQFFVSYFVIQYILTFGCIVRSVQNISGSALICCKYHNI